MDNENWDIYVCCGCGKAVALEEDHEINNCPYCQWDCIEYSHTMKEGETVEG